MPPKKKGTSQKPAKAKTPTLINGLTAKEMTKEQIEEHLLRLQEELDREREERNYFQLERDNVHIFWEIVERKLEVKNSEKYQEDDDEHFQEEIRVLKQKMEHLLCEHQNAISELKADELTSAEVQQKQQDELERVLLQKKQSILMDMEKLEGPNLIEELELKHTEEMTSTRNNWERRLTDIAKKEENIKPDQQLLENAIKSATLEQDIQGKKHIVTRIENCCKFKKCLHALGNLDKTHEENIKEIKEKFKESTKELNEGKKMFRTKIKKDVNVMRTPVLYSKDPFVNYKNSIRKLELECIAMEQKFSCLQLRRDELSKSFSEKIQKMHDDAAVGHTLMERKLQAMIDKLEKTRAQLHSLLSAPNMDHTGLSGVTNQILENLVFKNSTIKNLQKKYGF